MGMPRRMLCYPYCLELEPESSQGRRCSTERMPGSLQRSGGRLCGAAMTIYCPIGALGQARRVAMPVPSDLQLCKPLNIRE